MLTLLTATGARPEAWAICEQLMARQTYAGPVECVIVFDQTEPDQDVVSTDPRRVVRVMGNTERKPGLAGARNTGILASEGEYVAFCDDDDIWLPAKLAKQVAGIGTALTSATGIVIDYGGHRAERIPAKDTFKLENLVRNRIMEAHPSSVMVRRSAILDRIGLVDEELPGSYAEDFDFIIRALQAGPVAIVEEALVVVRWGQSLFSRNWGTIVAAVDYLIDKHQVIRDDPKALARLYGRRGFANAASGEYREALQDAWQAIRRNPLEKRAYVTLLAASRIVPATKLLDMAHRRGRGI